MEAYVYTMVREGTSPAEDYESEREIKATVWVGHRTSAALRLPFQKIDFSGLVSVL